MSRTGMVLTMGGMGKVRMVDVRNGEVIEGGTTELEWAHLDEPYVHLRVRESRMDGRLSASISEVGQRNAVLVVRRVDGRHVLIDGYRRVRALKCLGRDLVRALVLHLSEAEALTHCHRLETGRRRSALEDGWLIRELLDVERHSLADVSDALGRSKSWVSRRLGLVRGLPERVEQAVRNGIVPPHAAMKSLLPLARANAAHCESLVERIGTRRITTRETAAIYSAWRAGDAEQKERIANAPQLFLRAIEPSPTEPENETLRLVRTLEQTCSSLSRAKSDFERAITVDKTAREHKRVRLAYRLLNAAYEALRGKVEDDDAEARHARSDLAATG